MGKSVMVIDDDDVFIYLMQRASKKIETISDFRSAVHGKDAAEKLTGWLENNELLPDVVFVDINMPVMDGFEFLEKYKEIKAKYPELQSRLVAMLTSSENEKDKEKAFASGVITKYIIKPDNSAQAVEFLTDITQ